MKFLTLPRVKFLKPPRTLPKIKTEFRLTLEILNKALLVVINAISHFFFQTFTLFSKEEGNEVETTKGGTKFEAK